MVENERHGGTRFDPETFSFLQTGWWIFHVIAIAGIFYLGYLVGTRAYH